MNRQIGNFLIAFIFGINLIFGLPVEETTTEIPEDDNSTNGTHKELPSKIIGKKNTNEKEVWKFEIPETKAENESETITLTEFLDEEVEIANITDTEYDYYDGNYTTKINDTKLYIIKATTYEIGVLADVSDSDNTTADGPVVKQQVDLSFYNTESNDSHINFGDVPLPVQTNVSGQIITGIAPVHIGAVDDVKDVLKNLPFSASIVNITESDTSYIHLTRDNLTQAEQEIKIDGNNTDLGVLPILKNVLLPENFHDAISNVTKA